MYNLTHFINHLRGADVTLLFDVGANTGEFATQVRTAGFDGQIISFEPLCDAHAALSATANGIADWEIAPKAALGARSGTADINVSQNSYSSSLRSMLAAHLDAAPELVRVGAETVQILTLDDYIEQRFAGNVPAFALKLDTQGFEHDVLAGLVRNRSKCISILLELPLIPLLMKVELAFRPFMQL